MTTVEHLCKPPPGDLTVLATAAFLVGLDAHPVRVEVCCLPGAPSVRILGLAESAAREVRVRVASALAGLGIVLSEYAVAVNLVPVDLPKSGATLDLAIAAALLGALGVVPTGALEQTMIIGELALDGSVRPVRGVLPLLQGARSGGFKVAIVPADNATEAGLVQGLEVSLVSSLDRLIAHLRGEQRLANARSTPFEPVTDTGPCDLSEVRGQESARRALAIAASGSHNLLMIGPPGSGKTLLARVLPGLLPPLTFEEALECTSIHSVAGLLSTEIGVVDRRPFRAPHHSVSEAGLVGGGDAPRPGEVSLAHHGVLFLDELPEFCGAVLEVLRRPLEEGHVSLARKGVQARFPARPLVVAAASPCPCGYFGHPRRACHCSEEARRRYEARMAGPLRQCFDLQVAVPPLESVTATNSDRGEPSAEIRARVSQAREWLYARAKDEIVSLDCAGQRLLESACAVRSYPESKVLRVARTIAALEGSEQVRASHVAEALQLRGML